MPEFLPLPEAALRLGVSQSALRRRLRAGTAQGERRPTPGGFTWWVSVPDAAPTPAPTAPAPETAAELLAAQEAVKRLEAHVASLTDELAARRREATEERDAHHRQVQALMALLGREQLAGLPTPTPEPTPPVLDAQAPPTPPDTTLGAPTPTPTGPPTPPGWWRRAWSWLNGPQVSA
jgi:hypothetical protein